jgi:plasmid stabilization system protein ParE
VSYKLTKKAEADLAALVDFSLERFGSEVASSYLDKLERSIAALARSDFDGPELTVASRSRPVRRWPVSPYWLYYDRTGGVLRILRIYHGAGATLTCDGGF